MRVHVFSCRPLRPCTPGHQSSGGHTLESETTAMCAPSMMCLQSILVLSAAAAAQGDSGKHFRRWGGTHPQQKHVTPCAVLRIQRLWCCLGLLPHSALFEDLQQVRRLSTSKITTPEAVQAAVTAALSLLEALSAPAPSRWYTRWS